MILILVSGLDEIDNSRCFICQEDLIDLHNFFHKRNKSDTVMILTAFFTLNLIFPLGVSGCEKFENIYITGVSGKRGECCPDLHGLDFFQSHP